MRFLSCGIAIIVGAYPTAAAPAQPREPTDVYIRRLAGLPAETAKGEIEIIDVGHDPMSTMLSIVGNRTAQGWQVTYACAGSPQCAPGRNHAAKAYTLSADASAELDRILTQLRSGAEPEDPSHHAIGGHLAVRIDYQGFRREYRRSVLWGKTLGRLEALMTAPAARN
jgi:hypothetical protein